MAAKKGREVIDRGKRSVLGVQVNVVDYNATVRRIIQRAHQSKPYAVSALAVHGVMTGALDDEHRYRLNRLDMVVPDGQPVRWALRLLHREKLSDRVYGPTLMLKICEAAAEHGLAVYLYGSSTDVLARLEENLVAQFPKLIVAGRSSSRFRQVDDETNDEIMSQIRKSGARLVFAGLGCPRQEVFAFENAQSLSLPVVAVGAAFDFHAGTLEQAPRWMQERGLEWLFRLSKEPKRLWRRYLILNPLFCMKLANQWARPEVYDRRPEVQPAAKQNFA